jgi:hypothetical protein
MRHWYIEPGIAVRDFQAEIFFELCRFCGLASPCGDGNDPLKWRDLSGDGGICSMNAEFCSRICVMCEAGGSIAKPIGCDSFVVKKHAHSRIRQ